MKQLRNISIKNKIIGLILFTSAISMGIGMSFLLINDIRGLKKDMQNNVQLNTRLIGDYCIAPLTFDDKEGAENILSRLQNIPYIDSGILYDRNGVLFASYHENEKGFIEPILSTSEKEVPFRVEENKIILEHQINYRGDFYGTIVITGNTTRLNKKINQQILVVIAILFGMLLFAYIIANQIQKVISNPILKLANFARDVSLNANYDVEIQANNQDEIGQLYSEFNQMLKQIKIREEARDEAEKKLEEAKNKAEESDKLKSAFLANMSHEIRTPMNAILGFTELLTMDNAMITEKEREHYVKLIHNSGNNLLHLIDDIIDISKIEAGQLKIKEEPCQVNQLLKNICESYQEIKKQKGKPHIDIRLKKEADEKEIIIKTDPIRLQQVLSNLIDNALKFTEDGYIEFGFTEYPENRILFYVKDTGIGMNKEKKNLIFDRFLKLEDDKSRLYRGAGLGLAISKSLIELLKGEIWVESNPGEGSIFYFSIPRKEIEEPAKKSNNEEVNERKKFNWTGKTILIAEDEPANAAYLQEVLRITNVSVLLASNGKEAVKKVKTNKIDLILMDIKMPEMNGFQASKEIKLFDQNIPIISQTAYAMPGEKEKSKEAGMIDHLIKPIKPKLLLNVIEKHIYGTSKN